jgi:hypothetical protein
MGIGYIGAGTALFSAYHVTAAAEINDDDSKSSTKRTTNSGKFLRENMEFKILPACMLLWVNGITIMIYALKRHTNVLTTIHRSDRFPLGIRGLIGMSISTGLSTVLAIGVIVNAELGSRFPFEEEGEGYGSARGRGAEIVRRATTVRRNRTTAVEGRTKT